jgi:hypothetical protein
VDQQRIKGNQNVQIQEVENSWIKITYDAVPRVLPLESPQLSLASEWPSPARLVSARAGVFDYVGRGALFADLEAWIHSPAPFSAQMIAGRGGSGKTRLAVELCLRLREWDWLCGFLARGDGEGRLDALVEAPTARLVVIDYAENRADQLELLLPQLSASASEEEPVRVLLLVRTSTEGAEGRPRLLGPGIESVERVIEGCGVRVLEGDERLDFGERTQLFDRAVLAFGEYTEPSSQPAQAPALSHPIFETPLMVVIAAFLAAYGEKAPSSRIELLDGLLEHERRYWREGAVGLGADNALLERIVAVATLVNAESESQAAEHLRLLTDLHDATAERRNQLARWVSAQYPGPRWWNPLEPDLIGEHLVASCFAHQPEVLRGALVTDRPEEITRPLEVLARAGADHPDLAKTLSPILSEELERLCGVAIEQAEAVKDTELLYGGAVTVAAAIDALVSVVEVDSEVLPGVLNLLSPRANLVLTKLAAGLTANYVERLRPLARANPAGCAPELARALNNLSIRLSHAGRHPEALEAIEEAVEASRPLAKSDPTTYAPNLAMALNNLSNRLSHADRHPEALEAIEEAVGAYRPLARANPAVYAPYLADSLNNLSIELSAAGHHAEALEASEEAVETLRPLAKANPAAHTPTLAAALTNLSSPLSSAGRHPEALEALEEAVETYRPLARANPATDAPSLATVLNNFSLRLSGAGRHQEALEASEEAVETLRPVAEANPAAYASDLAMALNTLMGALSGVGRHPEALEAIEEAVELRRPLAEANPAAYAPGLATALSNLAVALSYADRHPEALEAIEEAVETYRPLAEANPAAHTPNLTDALNNLSVELSIAGHHPEALEAIEEAVEALRPLVEANPAAYAPNLASFLKHLAKRLGEAERDDEAEVARQEAAELVEPLHGEKGE